MWYREIGHATGMGPGKRCKRAIDAREVMNRTVVAVNPCNRAVTYLGLGRVVSVCVVEANRVDSNGMERWGQCANWNSPDYRIYLDCGLLV